VLGDKLSWDGGWKRTGDSCPPNSMELSCSIETASSPATQEFLNILRNSNVHCRVYKSTPQVPILISTQFLRGYPVA
jgi:hypothetical protein